MHLLAIRNLEIAEKWYRRNNHHNPRDPNIMLNERETLKIFKTSNTQTNL